MKYNRYSRSAERTAGLRALHTLYEFPPVFNDPYAVRLTNPLWRLFLRWGGMARFLANSQAHLLTAIRGQVVARSRYAEDGLAEAIAAGVRQYVIVGSGMDSFALRHNSGPDDLVVYEVDHPASLRHKHERLSRLGLLPSTPVRYCPIDLERASLFDGLVRGGFDRERPAWFSWLGVSYYISREAIAGLLSAIAREAAPGSGLVFDYGIAEKERDGLDEQVWAVFKQSGERLGEPLISRF